MFKPVSGNAIDIKKTTEPHTGTYTGHEAITTKFGPQVVFKFMGEDGQPFGIYGFTNLNRCMNAVAEGNLCRITYKGTQKLQTKYGLKDVHQVLVEVDDEVKPPISSGAAEEKSEVPF